MGKQRRKKNNNRKKGPPKSNPSSASSSSEKNPNTSSNTGSSSLISKIRHGDVRVRHGALSALSSTVFSSETLLNNKQSRVIKMELFQAVAERILDDDVPCSLCAVGCIANYILFQDIKNDLQSTVFDANRVETVLTPILLSKMNKACDQIKVIHDDMVKVVMNDLASTTTKGEKNMNVVSFEVNSKPSEKDTGGISSSALKKLEQRTRQIMEQFSLLSLSLHAFCGLVEIFTTNNTSSSLLHHESDKFLSTTMRSFVMSNEMILCMTNATSTDISVISDMNTKATTIVNKAIAKNENESDVISDVSVYSSRTIHSSSDDNPEFIKKILSTNNYWKVVSSSITNTTLPTMSRLHMAGFIVASRQVIVTDENNRSASNNNVTNIDEIITNQIIPILSQCTMYSTDIAQALCQQILLMESKLQKEKDDEKLESDVIKMVDSKKESARLIARRQKAMKALAEVKKDATMEENDTQLKKGGDVGNNVEGDVEMNSNHLEEIEDKYDKAVNAWKNSCLPLKMAVEVIANLCSAEQYDDGNDVFDESMDEYWDSDNEKDLLPSQNAMKKQSVETIELFEKVTKSGLPDRVLSVFGCLLLPLLGPQKDQLPKVALDDIVEIVSKCSICLGNIVCNLEGWKAEEVELQAVWKEFFQCLRSSFNGEINVAKSVLPVQAVASLVNAMVPFLKFRPALTKCVDESDFELILSHVLIEISHNDMTRQDVEAVNDIQKDTIGMIGLLSSEPHSDAINDRICSTLLAVLRKPTLSAAVMSELLNVLMDMYSADEEDLNNHESIFRKNNVLSAFENSIPVLKRKIREESRFNPIDTPMWKETTLNASRFIKYKKGC